MNEDKFKNQKKIIRGPDFNKQIEHENWRLTMPRRETRSELKVSHKATDVKNGPIMMDFNKFHDRYDLPNFMDYHIPKRTEL